MLHVRIIFIVGLGMTKACAWLSGGPDAETMSAVTDMATSGPCAKLLRKYCLYRSCRYTPAALVRSSWQICMHDNMRACTQASTFIPARN